MYCENYDTSSIVMPVRTDVLDRLLKEANYNSKKREYLVQGFQNGFLIGYKGKTRVRQTAPNLKFNVGDEIDLWNKVMKEVQLKRYVGPFGSIPFRYYIQSPIGLVPKDGGQDTRLIFHLSYP